MGLNENFCKKRKNKFAFCVKMSTLALSYRALRFEILHFGKIPFALGIFFYFALREFLKKFSKNKALFLLRKGAFTKRKKRKCDTANYNPNG